jgi:hypothetical protein
MSSQVRAKSQVRRFGGYVLSASVLIAFINLEKVVTEGIQMLRQPIGIGQRFALVDRRIKSGPAPPSQRTFDWPAISMCGPWQGAIMDRRSYIILRRNQQRRNHPCPSEYQEMP